MNILLLHPVAQWSLERVAALCHREGWRLTIVTIEEPAVAVPAAPLHDWIRVAALSDSPEVLMAQIGSRSFDAVVAGNEFAVIAADVLAQELGVRHNDVVGIHASRNKVRMREMFARNDVPQPRVIGTLSSVEQSGSLDWTGVAFPVIVKPIDMAMSLFVRRCDSRDEVERTLVAMLEFKTSRLTNYVFEPGALVEEFVDGPEFSLECVVQDGAVVAHALTAKFVSPLPACYETGHLVGTNLPERHREPLLRACERIAAGWGMAGGVMHVEFKMTTDHFSIIEAAARPAGGHVPEIVELQYGLSLEDAFLHLRAGQEWQPPQSEARQVWHGIRFDFAERSEVPCPADVEVIRRTDHADEVIAGAAPWSVNRRSGYSVLRSESLGSLQEYLRTL